MAKKDPLGKAPKLYWKYSQDAQQNGYAPEKRNQILDAETDDNQEQFVSDQVSRLMDLAKERTNLLIED